ncbi:MAG: response regulator [Synergistaceae bacterium]|nr:response regulator [Synergistaceae bacterium]
MADTQKIELSGTMAAGEVECLRGEVMSLNRQIKKLNRELVSVKNAMELAVSVSNAHEKFNSALKLEKQRHEQYLNLLLANSIDLIILLDKEGRFAYCTDEFLRIAGIPGFGFIHGREFEKIWGQYIDVVSAKRLNGLLEEVKAKMSAVETDISFDIGGEGLRSYSAHIALMANASGVADGYMILAHDTTEILRAKEAAERANFAKSAFLARMSHEIRTPMNAIIGMSELALREDMSPPSVVGYVSGINQAGLNLLSIINDVLDFSKIESGLLQIENAPYKIASVLNDVISVIRTRIEEKRALFLVDVDPRIPGSLCGDSARLRQILINLLGNAVKYTQEGFIRLAAKGISKDDGTIVLNFVVSDSGIGIKPEDIGNISGDFVRVDAERNSGIEGTGLGLSISRSLCRAMGGDISVTSVYGHGSEFTVTLPQFIDSAEVIASVNDREKFRVLLYHKRPLYAESISRTLESLGVAFRAATEPHDFFHELEGGCWTHVFVPAAEADAVREIVRKNLLSTKAVLLADIGEELSPSGLSSIMLPAWAISVANSLNGVCASVREKSLGVRFIAPKARILIVDDIATNLQVVSGLLSPYRVKTDTCLSGAEALELVMKHEYDMVLMDHMMPGMDGIEATRRIRELDEGRFAKLPIIALTANAISGMREKFLQSGFDDYLAKPIEISKLNAIIEKWMPEGKQVKSVTPAAKDDSAPAFIEIEGLDTARGIAMTGGTKEGYIKVLKLYSKDAAERLIFLRDFAEKIRDAQSDDSSLALFITQVHALKSASASIGAAEISRDAAALETAGKNYDIEAIKSVLGAFCDGLASLGERISRAVQADCRDGESSAGSSTDENLRRLKDALASEDVRAADEILAELQRSQDTLIGEFMSRISDCVLVSDFKRAAGELEALQATLKRSTQ